MQSNNSEFVVFTGNANRGMAEEIAKHLGTSLGAADVGRFSDGEVTVEIKQNVRTRDVFVVQPTCAPTNDNLMELVVMADAFRRSSATRITAVIPYFGYARQDRRPRSARVAISAKVVADMLTVVGIDRVLTVDLHADQIQGFFDGPVDHMHAMPILVDYIKSKYATDNITVVSPDAGRVKVAEKWAHDLGDAPLAFVHKTRSNTEANKTVSNRVVGDVEGKDCVLLDDMIDTGGTIAGAVRVLKDAGAKKVIIACTHGVFSDPARERLSECGAEEVITTDTLPQSTEGWSNLTVLSIAPLLAQTIHEIFENGSVTTLFDRA